MCQHGFQQIHHEVVEEACGERKIAMYFNNTCHREFLIRRTNSFYRIIDLRCVLAQEMNLLTGWWRSIVRTLIIRTTDGARHERILSLSVGRKSRVAILLTNGYLRFSTGEQRYTLVNVPTENGGISVSLIRPRNCFPRALCHSMQLTGPLQFRRETRAHAYAPHCAHCMYVYTRFPPPPRRGRLDYLQIGVALRNCPFITAQQRSNNVRFEHALFLSHFKELCLSELVNSNSKKFQSENYAWTFPFQINQCSFIWYIYIK